MYCVGLMLMVSVLAGYLVGFVAYLCRLTQFSLSRPHLTRAVLVMGQLTLIRLLPVGQPRSTYGSGHLYAPRLRPHFVGSVPPMVPTPTPKLTQIFPNLLAIACNNGSYAATSSGQPGSP